MADNIPKNTRNTGMNDLPASDEGREKIGEELEKLNQKSSAWQAKQNISPQARTGLLTPSGTGPASERTEKPSQTQAEGIKPETVQEPTAEQETPEETEGREREGEQGEPQGEQGKGQEREPDKEKKAEKEEREPEQEQEKPDETLGGSKAQEASEENKNKGLTNDGQQAEKGTGSTTKNAGQGTEQATKGGDQLAEKGLGQADKTAKQGVGQAGKSAVKGGEKALAKEGAKKATEGALATTGFGAAATPIIEAADKAAQVAKKAAETAKEIKNVTGVDLDPTAEARKKGKKLAKWGVTLIIVLAIGLLILIPIIIFAVIPMIWRGSQTIDPQSTQDSTVINEIKANISSGRLVFSDPQNMEDIKNGNALRPTLKILNFLAQKHTKLTVKTINDGMGFSVDSVDSIKCISSTGEKLPEIPINLDYNYNWAGQIKATDPGSFDCAVGYYPNSDPATKGQYSEMFGPGVFKLSDLPKKGLSAAQEKIAEIVAQTISINNELNIALTSDDNLLPQEIVVDQSYMIQNIAKDDNNTLALVLKPNITAAYKDLPENTDSFASKANPTAALTINFLK